MAREVAADISDSEPEAVTTPKRNSTNGEKAPMAVDNDMSEEQGSDADSDDGSEYEIESILGAKRSGTGFTYLVSWKGYSSDHNSWVEEGDAGNATDLIADYWSKREKKAKKSAEKPKTASKAGRKSAARDTSAEPASTSAGKKRSRPKTKKDDESDGDQDSDGGRPKTSKKARKSTGKKTPESPAVTNVEDPIGNMEKYMQEESWEKLIKNVDTVERGPDDKLYVFFTLKTDNERHKQLSEVCRLRFPQHLITFYEGHLRWKMIDEGEDA